VQEKLNKYFHPDNWTANNEFHWTGDDYLISQIGAGKTILDVGCGYNTLKPHFGDTLHGIDPANPGADEMCSIEEFETKQYDVVLCLGSINFGDEFTIRSQINKIVQCTKEKGTIFWRQNPGRRDRPFSGIENVDFFPWSFHYNCIFADEVNCRVREMRWDNDRIYAVWETK
jgi:hypothetical protein